MEVELIQNYNSVVDKLSFVEQGLVSGVLFCCVLSVVETHTHQQQETTFEVDDTNNQQQPAATDEVFNELGEFVQLSRVSSSASFKGLFKVAENAASLFDDYSTSPIIVDYDDSMYKDRLRRHFETLQGGGNNLDIAPETNVDISSALLEFEIMAIIRSQIMRLVSGKDGLPLQSGMSAVERGIQESELLTFTSLTASDLYRAHQLQIFAEMVASETRPLPNFTGLRILDDNSNNGGDEEQSLTKRKFFRQIPALLLAQTLQREISTNPLTLLQYYPLTDELLLALHWPPLPRRHNRVLWKHAAAPQLGQETLTIMPAGQMIVRVEQSVPIDSHYHSDEHSEDIKADIEQWKQQPWLTAILEGNIMSVRLLPQPARGTASHSQASLSHGGGGDGHSHSQSHQEGDETAGAADDAHTTTNSKDTVQVPTLPCMFILEPADNSGRYMFFDGPNMPPQRKPDGHGTVCFSATYEQRGLVVSLCSNGDLKIANTRLIAPDHEYTLHNEKSRFISANGVILRHFCLAGEAGEDIFNANKHPFRMEAMHSDGTRELFVDKQALALFLDEKYEQLLSDEQLSKECFELKLLRQVPSDTALLTLTASGEVLCSSFDTLHGGYVPLDWQYQPQSGKETVQELVDAETRTVVRRYLDNRVIIVTSFNHSSTMVHENNEPQTSSESYHRVLFPDGTSILHSHRSGLLYLTREDKNQPSYPEVEIDLDIDAMCRGHAAGREVPINKGGERVRLRLALPCGAAAFVKYDTRVTASSNGSLHVVTQDRFDMLCRDDGELTVTPPTAWSAAMQQALDHDAQSTEEELNTSNESPPPPPVMTASRASILNGGDSLVSSLAGVESAINGKKSRATSNNISQTHSHHAATITAPLIRPRNSSRIASGTTATNRPPSPNSPVASSNKGIESTASAGVEPDATITVYLGRGIASLFDCEFNRFTIDLSAGRRSLYLHAHGAAPTTATTPKRGRSAEKAQKSKKDSGASRPITPSTAGPARAYSLTVDLAGEVIGLKPPAVAKSPKPPRLFLVSRQGDAVEVLPTQMLARWQQMVMRKLRSGMQSYVEEGEKGVLLSPAELGPARQWRYFLPARIGHAVGSDQKQNFSLFEGVVGLRAYLKAMRGDVIDGQKMVLLPAAARHVLRLMSKSKANSKNHIRVLEALSVVERPPLSVEGYAKVTAAIAKCEEFRNNRLKSIDRFAVADVRTPEMIEEEEAMTKRLKAAYKLAKITAAKRKENKQRQDVIEEGDEEEDGPASNNKPSSKQPSVLGSARSATGQSIIPSSARSLHQQMHKGPPIAGQHHAHHAHHGGHHGHGLSPIKAKEATILEASDEEEGSDGDDDDDGDDNDSDAGEKEVDPLQAALKAAFEDFADDQDLVPVSMLQEVFIRLLGRYVDEETIEQAAIDSGEVDPGIDEVTWSEFRAVYNSLDQLLNGKGPSSANQLLGEDEEVIDTATDDGDERGTDPGVEGDYYHMGLPSRGSEANSLSPPHYGRSAQSTAPMLNLQNLRQPSDHMFGSAANSPLPSAGLSEISRGGQGLAAGSALQFVRNVKSAGGH